MTIQVYIGREDFIGGLSIAVVDHFDGTQGPGRLFRPGEFGGTWEDFNPDTAMEPIRPSFKLPGEIGRALLDALVHHYQGAEDTRRLRADYDAERRRVDEQAKLIADVLRSIAGASGGR